MKTPWSIVVNNYNKYSKKRGSFVNLNTVILQGVPCFVVNLG
jgi:hypothetical protein